MQEKLICQSRKNKKNVGLVIFGILFFIFLYLQINHNQPNPVGKEYYFKQIMTIALIFFVLYCIFYLLNLKHVKVYKSYVEVNNLLKKQRIPYTEIIKLESLFIKGKYNSWTNYSLVLKSGRKIDLAKEEYSNFDDFFDLIKKKVEN